jgi:hypothetical protein
MLATLLVNTSGTTANSRIISGIKLDRIEMFGAPQAANKPIAIEWTSNYGPTSEISDQSLGASVISQIKTSPPRNSLAGFWSMTGSNEGENLCLITAPASTIINVYTTIVLQDGETPASQATAASGVTGTLYLTSFDGPGSGAKLVPQSYATLN